MSGNGANQRAWVERWGDALIAASVLVAYWPLTFFIRTLSAGDTLDCWLPWRHFISQALFNGGLPIWNPYQQMGTPVHADLQGPAWYVEALALGGTIGHDVYLLQVLFLAYVVIAGAGMRRLVDRLAGNGPWSVVVGVAFALSGFFTGHTQHFYSVISAAWFPWLLWGILGLLERPTWRWALVAAVFQSLLFTGGNHTFMLIGVYCIAALVLGQLVVLLRKGPQGIGPVLLNLALFAVVAVIMSIGTFHAWWEVRPYLARVEGLDLFQASAQPFPFRAWISIMLPSVSTLGPEVLHSDPAMVNGHFGVLLLPFIALGLMKRRPLFMDVLGIFGLIAAMASLGDALPVHGWLWRWVPGMDLFRFPGYFWYFTLLGALPIAGWGLRHAEELCAHHRSRLVLVIGGWTVALVLGLITAGSFQLAVEHDSAAPGLLAWLEQLDPLFLLILDAVLVTACVLFIGFLLYLRVSPTTAVTLGVVIQMVLAVQITQWHTSLGPYAPDDVHARIKAMPLVPFIPALEPMGESHDGGERMHWLWRNTQVFQGRPTHDGFNSFQLKGTQILEDDHPEVLKAMQRMPFVYLTENVQHSDAPFTERPAVISDAVRVVDDLKFSDGDTVSISSFDLDGMVLVSGTASPTFLVVQQAHYPGWEVHVDGVAVDVVPTNHAAFGAFLAAGAHQVEVRFRKPILAVLYVIGLSTLIGALLLLAFTAKDLRPLRLGAVLFLVAMLCWSFFAHRPKVQRVKEELKAVEALVARYPDVPVLMNSDRKVIGSPISNSVRTFRQAFPDELHAMASLMTTEADTLVVAWAGLPLSASMQTWFEEHYPHVIEEVKGADAGAMLVQKADVDLVWVQFDSTQRVLGPNQSYTEAIEFRVADVPDGMHAVVLVAEVLLEDNAWLSLVIERRRGGQVVDYEAVEVGHPDTDSTWVPVRVVRSTDRMGTDETLRAYLWLREGSALVKNTGVRFTPPVDRTP